MRRIRHTHGFMAFAMLFVVVLAVAVTPAAATDVTYSGQKIVINQPGTYVLKNDITNSNLLICIEIQASNVVFDGAGHTIDGVKAEGSAGIYVHGSSAVSGVTIKNVRMQDWYYGIYLHETQNSRVESSTLSNNVFTGAVIYRNAVGNTVTGSTITGNQYGVIFSDGATNGVVTDNQINQNSDRGLYVYLSDGITATRNHIENNINSGIQLRSSGGGTIYNNLLNNNLNVAFYGEPFKANAWSVTPGANWTPANIMGGPKVGGNFWGRPDGSGFSQTNADANGDGFIDASLQIAEQNFDYYPLALYAGPTPTTTTTVTTTTTTQSGQTPYRAVTLPGRLQAEDYDLGGEGIAYHDNEAANLGGAYRTTEGVDIESDGGVTNIGYIRSGEWTEYTVNVPTAGTYPATFRVAAWDTGRQIAISVDGVQKAVASLPKTGSYTSWQTVTVQIPIDAGTHVIRFAFNSDKQNLDYVDFGAPVQPTGSVTTTPTTTVTTQTTTTPSSGQTPYNGPHALPGTVQAEDFDNGGQNVAYWDSTVENKAATTAGSIAYRPGEYVDAETGNGISNIGWITNGEWTEYTVDVAATGSYTATFRVGSWANDRRVVVTVDGAAGCTITVPNTGGYTAFQEVSAPLPLTQGTHVIRLTYQGDGMNVDWFSVTGGPVTTVTTTQPTGNVTTTPTTTVTTQATTTTTPSNGQIPYNGPHALPGTVQAEDFDNGGQNVAYWDSTVENKAKTNNIAYADRGNEYVDAETGNGISDIGWITNGEWTEYTVDVAATGSYTATFRVGAWANDRRVVVTVDGAAGCTVSVPNTGNYETFQEVSAPLSLTQGTHVIRLTYQGDGMNVDWFSVTGGPVTTVTTTQPTGSVTTTPTTTVTTQATTTTTPSNGQTAYNGPHAAPGRVQAEDFDNGGQNVAYWDSTVENKAKTNNIAYADRGNEYVDAETGNGISDIGWITNGEWTEYTVDVAATGSYTATFRVGAWANDRRVVVTVDGAAGCTVTVPNTGNYETFQEISAPLSLTQGTHVIRLTYQGDGMNVDWFETVAAV